MTSLSTASRTASTGQRAVTWAPLAVILCGTFVYVLDFFVVNVALPSIQRDLAASAAAIEWVVAGYGLTSAAFLVTGGRLGDHYGRRKLFCVGIATFTVTSALCAVAPDAGFLVAARLAQGVGAAIMAPNVLSILGTTYTGPARVKAISVYGMVMGIAAVGGQLLGGLLIAANLAGLGWRVIFWVNVPVGIAALVLARRLVPESRATVSGTGRAGSTCAAPPCSPRRSSRSCCRCSTAAPTAGPPGRGRAWPPGRCCSPCSPRTCAPRRGAAASRCSTRRSSRSARSAPG